MNDRLTRIADGDRLFQCCIDQGVPVDGFVGRRGLIGPKRLKELSARSDLEGAALIAGDAVIAAAPAGARPAEGRTTG